MLVRESTLLAPHTSFHIGGPARFFIEVFGDADICEVATFAHERSLSLLPLGGGSNILVPDEGVEAVVAKILIGGLAFADDTLIAGAGVSWEALVSLAEERELWGVENLAGIPGSVGGALVQNIGAYGAELADTFLWADTFDFLSGQTIRITAANAALGYRSSLYKQQKNLVILRVALRLSLTAKPNLAYADLARVEGEGVPLATPKEIAAAVRAIRAGKFPPGSAGGTAGSFFKNPVVTAEHAAALRVRFPGILQFPQADGRVKLPLAWILDHALGLKGFSMGRAWLYEKQPLVVLAKGGAQASEVDALAQYVAARVYEATGIVIEREVETFGMK